ncbi:MAG: Fic family protein [Gemmataceae bacterium]|nr:Fic family protein [Gemmataceae bacterium]
MTLRQLSARPESIPTATSWYLADLGQALGKQELFTRQAPQRLKALREHALIESAVASNRIEGVEVEPDRVGTVVFGKSHLRDRDEEEVRGYRNALKLIHEQARQLSFSEGTLRRLHRISRGGIGDAGQYKERNNDIVEKHPDGRTTIRFRTVSAAKTPAAIAELVQLGNRALRERWAPPLIVAAACNLDFLGIHPFRDGNGRVSRLLLLLQAYHFGLEVGRYISLEGLIERTKDRYYETLKISSQRWHEGKHDPWPYINYLLYTLLEAYRELERRVQEPGPARGAKTSLILAAIERFTGAFQVADLVRECPGVGVELIRRVLKESQASGRVECVNRGRNARWKKTLRPN